MQDEQNDYVNSDIEKLVVLVPVGLYTSARESATSTLIWEGTENAKNQWAGIVDPYTSPYVTENSATTWYALHEPKRACKWVEVYPLQIMQQKEGSDDLFKRDLVGRWKTRFMGALCIVMWQRLIKCEA